MLSIINFTAYKCCDRGTCLQPVNDVARKCSEPLPWVDMAIGIILCIIGGLAQHFMIPAPVGQILMDVGGAQIGVGAFMFMARPCEEPCNFGYNFIRENLADMKEGCLAMCCCCLKN